MCVCVCVCVGDDVIIKNLPVIRSVVNSTHTNAHCTSVAISIAYRGV